MKINKGMRNIFFSSIGLMFLLFSGYIMYDKEIVQNAVEEESLVKTDAVVPPFLVNRKVAWVDSLMKTMTLEDKIGQLFMVAAYSNKGDEHLETLESLVTGQKIGGLIFFQGTPTKQLEMTNALQQASEIPLMIGMDAEWGLAMRLDSTHKFPKEMTLGAIENDGLIYEMGAQMADHCNRMGVHINFSPVADVNNNAANPVINYRSFGENKHKVTKKSLALMNGMQDNGVMANAKHFPGHGDTDSDSHKTLPIISHSLERLDSVELYPFKSLIDSGVSSMMIAHLYIPSLDNTPNKASTLSKNIVTDLLQIDLGFKGLIFTDALNMRGVSAFFNPGQLEVAALKAGNDVLLFPEDVPAAVKEIKLAIKNGELSKQQIEKSCKKILLAKHWLGLEDTPKLQLQKVTEDLNDSKSKFLTQKLYENALTVIKNQDEILPLKNLSERKIAVISIGNKKVNPFTERLDMYCKLDEFSLSHKATDADVSKLLSDVADYNTIIVGTFNLNQRPYRNFGFHAGSLALLDSLGRKNDAHVVLSHFGNPYALALLKNLDGIEATVVNYEENEYTTELAASLIFGGIGAKGTLPVTINSKFPEGHGLQTEGGIRMKYTYPEELGILPSDLTQIDKIADQAIKDEVFPGCQILVAKDGKVFYYKSFGNHTYDSKSKKVENTDIYDLASVTKIASSTAALMKLQSEGIISVDSTLGTYLKDMVDTTDYADIKLKEMLTHQAGFAAWIPFYLRTLHKGQPKIELYSIKKSDYFSERVAENLYVHSGVRDSIFNRIVTTDVKAEKKYLYSDLGYYFINEILRRKTKTTQDKLLDSIYYHPLGLENIGYKPREKWSLDRIPPTEDENSFRHQLIHADVHDQGAAMLGGVCGHAGLFANANDLAVMMELFKNYGSYGGEKYYDRVVGEYFTSSPYYATKKNRRGIGFDKPVPTGGSGPTCSKCASNKSFGHSGFTGTLTWADPDNGMVYVFLSNRVHPDAMNRKIITMSIRTRIMKVIYDAINRAEKGKKGS